MEAGLSPSETRCSRCGSANASTSRFCVACGASLQQAGPPPSRPAPGAPATALGGQFLEDLQERAKRQVLPLAVVALVGFLDYQLHANVGAALIVVLAGAGVALFFREVTSWLAGRLNFGPMAPWVSTLFVSVPIALYFFARAKGTLSDGDAMPITIAIAGLPAAFNWLAPRLDPALQGFYEARDRLLPVAARPLVLLALSLIVTFGIIHGNLGDVKILFGATASKAAFPDANRILLSAVLNVVLAFALLHRPAEART